MKLIKRIEINPPKRLIIGDPMYLERGIAEGLTCQWKRLSYATNVKAEIEVFEETFDSFKYYVVRLNVLPEEFLNDIHCSEKKSDGFVYYPKLVSGKIIELGCDTAEFIVENEKDYVKIDTGADGYYGMAIKYKNKLGIQVVLNFDAAMADYRELVNMFV